MKVTIRRQFAVILEDAVQVTVPDDLGDAADASEWAIEHYDELYLRARDNPDLTDPVVLWEDEHKSDDTGIDDVYTVEIEP